LLLKRKRSDYQENNCLTSKGHTPLTALVEGTHATVTHANGGIEVVLRLSEMGLTPGCEIKIMRKCSFRGAIEIEIRGVTLALGYDLASKICVQPTKANLE
jgi:Fe2+ transport system protein FeoA